MSKIHQAIRRAEREGQDLIQRSPVRRAILEDSRKETVEPRTLQEQIVQEFQNQESSPSRRLEAGEYTALRIPTGSKLVALETAVGPQISGSFPSQGIVRLLGKPMLAGTNCLNN